MKRRAISRDAVQINERMGARPWTAHSQHDLADVLRRRNVLGDRQRAGELERAAMATARSLGMALAPPLDPEVETAPADSAKASASVGTFRREGEYWTIEFEGDAFRARDSKGMWYLARLLHAPSQELHALELARPASPASRSGGFDGGPLAGDALGDSGPALDAAAKAAYRERLADLRSDLSEAEAWNDHGRAERSQDRDRCLDS